MINNGSDVRKRTMTKLRQMLCEFVCHVVVVVGYKRPVLNNRLVINCENHWNRFSKELSNLPVFRIVRYNDIPVYELLSVFLDEKRLLLS